MSKNLLVKRATFTHWNIHKYTLLSSDGKTQSDCGVLTNKDVIQV
jgi:hypothetical protein